MLAMTISCHRETALGGRGDLCIFQTETLPLFLCIIWYDGVDLESRYGSGA